MYRYSSIQSLTQLLWPHRCAGSKNLAMKSNEWSFGKKTLIKLTLFKLYAFNSLRKSYHHTIINPLSGNCARRMDSVIKVWYQFSTVKFCPDLEIQVNIHKRKFYLEIPAGVHFEKLLQPLDGKSTVWLNSGWLGKLSNKPTLPFIRTI